MSLDYSSPINLVSVAMRLIMLAIICFYPQTLHFRTRSGTDCITFRKNTYISAPVELWVQLCTRRIWNLWMCLLISEASSCALAVADVCKCCRSSCISDSSLLIGDQSHISSLLTGTERNPSDVLHSSSIHPPNSRSDSASCSRPSRGCLCRMRFVFPTTAWFALRF